MKMRSSLRIGMYQSTLRYRVDGVPHQCVVTPIIAPYRMLIKTFTVEISYADSHAIFNGEFKEEIR